MNKFDLQSAKFLSIIIGICLIFVLVIWHAFSFLPEEDNTQRIQPEVTVPSDNEENVQNIPEDEETNTEEEGNEDEDEDAVSESSLNKKNETKKITSNDKSLSKNKQEEQENLEPLEPIDESNTIDANELKQSDNMSFSDIINKANEYKMARNFNEAIEEYKKAISVTDVSADKAICYDNLALIYAVTKRYGSAIIAAQKAYNAQPNINREFMIARLYYKTGKIEEAQNRIFYILRKEFTLQ